MKHSNSIAYANAASIGAEAANIADMPDEQTGPMLAGEWFILAGLASLIAVASLLRATDLTIDPWATASLVLFGSAAIVTILWWSCRARASKAEEIAQDFAESVIAFSFVSLVGAIASYPVMALSHGFSDAVLAESDHLMGFNWVAWYEVVAAHPLLEAAGRFAYQCIFLSPPILLGYFACTGRKAEARRFIATFWLAAVLTLALAALVPAQGPLVYLWHGVVGYVPSTDFYQADLIPLLRAHKFHVIDPGALRGLVSAPSFHTASAVIFIAAAWPFVRIRNIVAIINAAMLLATVVEGSHYLTDMLCGAIVAVFSVAAMGGVTSWLGRSDASEAARELWPVGVVSAESTAPL